MYNSEQHYNHLYSTTPREFEFCAESEEELTNWQETFRDRLRQALGLHNIEMDLGHHQPKAEMLKTEDMGDHIREEWYLWVEPTVPLPFYLLRPKEHNKGLPLALTPHGHSHQHIYVCIANNQKEEEDITEGEIDLDGKTINKIDPSERDVAMVFQNYALYPHMNVYKNLSYGLKNKGESKEEINKKVNDVAELLEIHEYLQRKPGQLSGGQRQRVAMGRAIVRNPKVFLFDEPLSNLDAQLRGQVRIEIKKLQRSMNVTSVFVTHDQVEAMTLGDRLAVINNGVIEQLGTPIEVYEKPASKFVGEFIGSPQMNFVNGTIKNNIFESKSFKLNIDSKIDSANVVLGFRAEDLHLKADGEISLTIDIIEKLGSDSIIYGKDKDGQSICCLLYTSPSPRDATLSRMPSSA